MCMYTYITPNYQICAYKYIHAYPHIFICLNLVLCCDILSVEMCGPTHTAGLSLRMTISRSVRNYDGVLNKPILLKASRPRYSPPPPHHAYAQTAYTYMRNLNIQHTNMQYAAYKYIRVYAYRYI